MNHAMPSPTAREFNSPGQPKFNESQIAQNKILRHSRQCIYVFGISALD